MEKFQTDPHWHDLLLFHEYFHGAGIGASLQTGWTGTVAVPDADGGRSALPIRSDGRRVRLNAATTSPIAAAASGRCEHLTRIG